MTYKTLAQNIIDKYKTTTLGSVTFTFEYEHDAFIFNGGVGKIVYMTPDFDKDGYIAVQLNEDFLRPIKYKGRRLNAYTFMKLVLPTLLEISARKQPSTLGS